MAAYVDFYPLQGPCRDRVPLVTLEPGQSYEQLDLTQIPNVLRALTVSLRSSGPRVIVEEFINNFEAANLALRGELCQASDITPNKRTSLRAGEAPYKTTFTMRRIGLSSFEQYELDMYPPNHAARRALEVVTGTLMIHPGGLLEESAKPPRRGLEDNVRGGAQPAGNRSQRQLGRWAIPRPIWRIV